MAKKRSPSAKPQPKPASAPAKPSPDDDVIVVPKGQSKMRFFFILGLMIFTLIIFTIGDQFTQAFGTRTAPAERPAMAWDHPSKGRLEVDVGDWFTFKRALDNFYWVQNRRSDFTDDFVARMMVLDELALDAGIEISPDELRDGILQGFGRGGPDPALSLMGFFSGERYQEALRYRGVSPGDFESIVRRCMRVLRYQQMLGFAVAQPTPEAIIESWKEVNQEHAFDYVELAVEGFREAAGAELPEDAELELWYADLADRDLVFFEEMLPERYQAEFVGLRVEGEETAAGLLERYPLAEGEDLEALARSYYDFYYDVRFRRPEPLSEDQEPEAAARLYQPFEEVVEACRREAPIRMALLSWLRDLQVQAAGGEELALTVEAERLGLFFEYDGVARSQADWAEREDGLGGPFLAEALRNADPTGLPLDVSVTAQGVFLPHVIERHEAGLPEMAAIRERVVEEWTAERAGELALEALEAQRTALALYEDPEEESPGEAEEPGEEDPAEEAEPSGHPKVDAEVFLAQVVGAGYQVGHRDFLRANLPPARDPLGELPAHQYIRGNYQLAQLEEGEVIEPTLDADEEHAYLIRAAGQRDPVEVDVDPMMLKNYRMLAGWNLYRDFQEKNFSAEGLRERYGLWVDAWERTEEWDPEAEEGVEPGEEPPPEPSGESDR